MFQVDCSEVWLTRLCSNVQVENVETLDRAMNSIKHKGFINYYGKFDIQQATDSSEVQLQECSALGLPQCQLTPLAWQY